MPGAIFFIHITVRDRKTPFVYEYNYIYRTQTYQVFFFSQNNISERPMTADILYFDTFSAMGTLVYTRTTFCFF